MRSLHDRSNDLLQLSIRIEEEREKLRESIISDLNRTRKEATGEINLAIKRLRSFKQVIPSIIHREPVGKVAIMFPGNAALSNPIATIGNAYLAGNKVIARFPHSSKNWGNKVERLIRKELYGVSFIHESGQKFLNRVANDLEVKVIIVFGDDSWAIKYKEVMKNTKTKFIFEGPGKDPFIVLDDADIEKASLDAVRSCFYNSGQACTSSERFYVHENVHEEFVINVLEKITKLTVGRPTEFDTDIGPHTNEFVVSRIKKQIADSIYKGAIIRTGGKVNKEFKDYYIQPTLITNVNEKMLLMKEETFGPILPVQKIGSSTEAIQLSSNTRYGLAASLYGGGNNELKKLKESHGMVFHNEIWMDYYKRNPHAPYGGRKKSGWIWSWDENEFVEKDGPRLNAIEFTKEI